MTEPAVNDDARELRLQTVCLLALTLLAAGITLWLLRPVLVPFVLALFFVIGLSPLLDYIQRRLKVPRAVAIGISFLLGVLLVSAFAALLYSSVVTIKQNRLAYEESVQEAIVWGVSRLEAMGVDLFGDHKDLTEEQMRQQLLLEVGKLAQTQTRDTFIWLSGALLDLMISLGVVLIFMFFLLAGASSEVRPTTGLWAEIEGKIRGYIVTKTVISFFTGLAFGGVLWVFGVPFAIQLGVLAFLLNYVPNVGPVVACALPVPIVLFMMPGIETNLVDGKEVVTGFSIWWKTLALVAGMAVQLISGNVVEPKIMGDSFELHPIVILLSLILWGMIWGPVGVLLAVPMTAAVKVLLERLDRTRPIAALLAGHLEPLETMIEKEGGVA